jgi:2-polyprenyl-3-methyl-5-hydroxy-6-metoxy-1,4-benzoquinol methylase
MTQISDLDGRSASLLSKLQNIKHSITQECSPNDDMLYRGDLPGYMSVGYTAARHIILALIMAEQTTVRSILDMPCGHGRVMRWLRQIFPDAQITGCELDRDGVDYCAEKFGAKKLYSAVNPKDISCNEKFDLIWCGSLMTHLSEERSREFLNFFKEHLEDGGMMIVTFHGRGKLEYRYSSPKFKSLPRWVQGIVPYVDFRKVTRGLRMSGFGHSAEPGQEYGTSYTYPRWVAKWIEEDPNFRIVYFNEGGFGYTQDILALQKSPVDRRRGAKLDWPVSQFLQRTTTTFEP